jgi:hypothetical protein
MPGQGWKSIPVRDEVYEILEKKAAKQNRSVANLVEVLLKEALEVAA